MESHLDFIKSILNTLTWLGPKMMSVIFILIVGVFFAFILKKIAKFLIKRSGDSNAKIWKYIPSTQMASFSNTVSVLVFWCAVILTAISSLSAFRIDVFTPLVRDISLLVPKIFSASLVLVFGIFLSKLLKNIVKRSTHSFQYKQSEKFSNISYLIFILITCVVATKQLGVEIEFLTTIILIIVSALFFGMGVSFGLGSAPIISSILSTCYGKSFLKEGDCIKVQNIEGVYSFSTKTSFVLNKDDKSYIVPSRLMLNNIVEVSRNE